MDVAGNLTVAVDGIAYGLLLYTVAAGLSVTFGTGNLLNLAHGTVYLLGAYLGWQLIDNSWTGMGLAVLAAMVAGTGAGVVVELLAGRLPHHLDQALVTIGVALIGDWCLTRVYGAQPRSVDPPPGMGGTVSVAGHPYPVYRLALICMAGGLAVGVSLAISRTRFGVLARATAADAGMVAQTGVEPRLVRAGTVAAGSALAAVAGVLGAPVVGPAPGVDHVMVMLSLVVVVVGGIGSTRGALLAALLVGQLQTTGVAAAPSVAPYLAYACLAAALVLRGALTQPVSR